MHMAAKQHVVGKRRKQNQKKKGREKERSLKDT